MRPKLDTIKRLKARLGGILFLGAALVAPVALAEPADLQDLAANPQNYLGQEIEMEGNCVKGGRSGDVLGYECTTDKGVYVDADDIAPETAKDKLGGECAGGKCRVTIRFTPHSYTTSGVIEPDRSVVVFNTEKAEVNF